MLKSLKYNYYLPFIALLGYLVFNLALIIQTMHDTEITRSIPWFIILWGVGLSIFTWGLSDHVTQKRGVIVFGTIVIGIGLTYLLLVLIPAGGFILLLGKIGLIVLCGLILLPLSYHIGKNIYKQEKPIKNVIKDYFADELPLSKSATVLIWVALFILITLYFVLPAFSRSEILGYDTPTYVLRARLIEKFGTYIHALYGGGYQIVFPLLSSLVHHFTGLDYIDIVRLLPPIMMAVISITTGYFAYEMFGTQSFAIIVALFTVAWGLAPHLIVDARDNIAVMLFGSLGMVFLSKTNRKGSWAYEILLLVALVLSGISHLTLSIIFISTTLLVNLLDFYDSFWLGERKDFLKQFWKAIRVPLISGIIIALIWLPVSGDFINSLGIGLRTSGELGENRDTSFGWIIKRYNLTVNLPWIVLGYLFVIWKVLSSHHSRNFLIVFVWSTICIIFGVVLKPISFLNSRFIAMIPTFLLIPSGFYYLWINIPKITNFIKASLVEIGLKISLIAIIAILLTSNLILNSKLLFDIPGLPLASYQKIDYVNKYIDTHHPQKPYIFLIEDIGPLSEAYSDLDRRIIRSTIADAGLLNTYVYFGTLDYFIRGQETPLTGNGLPELKSESAFANSSQRWFEELVKNKIWENQEMTVFIIKDFNLDIYHQYEYLPVVEEIGPEILVVNIPDDLIFQDSLTGNTP